MRNESEQTARQLLASFGAEPRVPHGAVLAHHLRAAAASVKAGLPLDRGYLGGLLLAASRTIDWHMLEAQEEQMRFGKPEAAHAVAIEILRRRAGEKFTAVDVIERHPLFTLAEVRKTLKVMAAMAPDRLRYRDGYMHITRPPRVDDIRVTHRPKRLSPKLRAEIEAILSGAAVEQDFYEPDMANGHDF